MLAQPVPPPPRAARPAAQSQQWPVLPGGKWRSKDEQRPQARVVTPGATDRRAPSDALVLFDGTGLSRWFERGKRGDDRGKIYDPPRWIVRDGYLEAAPSEGGDLVTKESFGNVQLHIEWATPAKVDGDGQKRGNSGIFFLGLGQYEVQILDSYNNNTYADGHAAAIYGQYPPLVNASRRPGEWQTYDIVFETPAFEGGRLVKPAHVTVFHNGLLVQLRRPYLGQVRRDGITYPPHPVEGPIILQNHRNPMRFRNIWIRRLEAVE